MEKKIDLEKYIDYYVDDEELSDEELEAYWRFIKGESDKLVNEMIGVKVKWRMYNKTEEIRLILIGLRFISSINWSWFNYFYCWSCWWFL